MSRPLESRLIDDLNTFGCTRETLRKRIRRMASSDLVARDIAEMFGCNIKTAERYLKEGREK